MKPIIKSEEKKYITKEFAYKNILEWLYVNDGAYLSKSGWRKDLLEVIKWNLERVK